MRVIDKLISFIFHVFVIVLAVTVLIVAVGFIDYAVINGLLINYLFNASYKLIVVSSAILVILAGLKITVFSSSLSNTSRKSILVDTAHGKIQINQDTIENVTKNVISEFDSIKDVHARMTKAKNGINMYLMLAVYQNTNIKEVVTKVQERVKTQVEATTSVIVRNIDVKIKNVSGTAEDKKQKQVPTVQEPTVNLEIDNSEEVSVEPQTTETQQEGQYMKDENGVLYTVEPNPNSDKQ